MMHGDHQIIDKHCDNAAPGIRGEHGDAPGDRVTSKSVDALSGRYTTETPAMFSDVQSVV